MTVNGLESGDWPFVRDGGVPDPVQVIEAIGSEQCAHGKCVSARTTESAHRAMSAKTRGQDLQNHAILITGSKQASHSAA